MFPCRPRYRPLFLLRPPLALARLIAADTAWLGPTSRVPMGLLHITLSFLGDWPFEPRRLLAAMADVGASLRFPPFRVVLDELRGGGRTVLLRPTERLQALHDFQHVLVTRLARAGIGAAGYRFNPHMTLRHVGHPELEETIHAVSWRVEEFLLVESLVGWSRHEVRGRWRLG